jgi:hypothetical protein
MKDPIGPEGIVKAQALIKAAKSNPHMVGHMKNYGIDPILMNSAFGNSLADFYAGNTPIKELIAKRNMTFADALEQARKNKPFNAELESRIMQPDHKYASPNFNANMGKQAQETLNKDAFEVMPKPKYEIGLYSSTDPDKSVRHELGHGAMTITGQPGSAISEYNANTDKYGYFLNPNEIRAAAISNKKLPFVKSPGMTYSKNSYMERIYDQIIKGFRKTRDVNNVDAYRTPSYTDTFRQDLNNMTLDMPSKFYDYLTAPISKYRLEALQGALK